VTQRQSYVEGTLDTDRQRRLQELPGWTWHPKADMWEEGFKSTPGLRQTPRRCPRPAVNHGRWLQARRVRHYPAHEACQRHP
jgi:hypothetical protein